MPMATLSINGVRKSFGAVEVLNNIDIEIDCIAALPQRPSD